ncbi:MAG: hypothetical protein ACJ74Y_05170, partial [Bryobacteraceae bacterium]
HRSICLIPGYANWRRPSGLLTCASVELGPIPPIFHDSDRPAPKTPPKGFNGVLTRPQWKGVVDFAHAVNAQIGTSAATGAAYARDIAVFRPFLKQAAPGVVFLGPGSVGEEASFRCH